MKVIDKKLLWALAEETMRAYMPSYQMAMRQAIEESGVPDRWFGLSLARGSDPAPFTARRYHAMFPYAAPAQSVELLDNLAQLELLEGVEEGAYRLTDKGRKAAGGIFEAAHRCLETVEPLPAGEMAHLNDLLYRIVKATLEAPEPAKKWAIAYSRWTDPGEKAPPSVKTDQYLTDLVRYRDDAHIAAWKPLGVSGHAWEALTFVWRDEAHTAGELAERLSFRAHSVEDYEEALQDLAARGWVVKESGAYTLTDEGKRIREEAEEATDRHFYVGWSALSQDELGQLHDLLTRANDNLRATALNQVGDLARELMQAVPAAVRDGVTPIVEEVGLDQPGFFHILLLAHRLAPDPISAARLSVRSPYVSPQRFDDVLTAVAGAGFLAPEGDGEYTFTDEGRSALHQVNHAFYTQLGELSTLTADELTQAQSLLKKVAEACLDAPEPASKLCISVVPNGLPSQEYAPLAQIDQRLDYLNAFRDDAHLAAWQPYGVSGHAWEAFTFVWRDEAHTAQELAEKLPRRGHSAPAYAEALSDLAGRGWVEETSDGHAYRLTEKGQALRQQAEEATDRYFFAPWTSLNNVEIAQLHTLLTRLRDSLQTAAENSTQTA